jgi:transcriptional regulator with XRE-family HTH domain
MPSHLTKSNGQASPSLLEAVLRKNNLTLTELADKLKLNRSSVSRWCLGETEPQLNTEQWKTICTLLEKAQIDIKDLPPDWYKRKLRN